MWEQNDEKVVALLCSDFHLSLKAPPWRSAEEDWFAAMRRPLDELKDLQLKYECPIICAGDIFDRWNSPPELINFALKYLPDDMLCIPGQHDLPDHNYEEMHRSAYMTLIRAKKIKNLYPHMITHLNGMDIYAFPFGTKLTKSHPKKIINLKVAFIHEYKWVKGKSYPNAPIENKLTDNIAQYDYDVIVYGDNHHGWLYANMEGTTIFNCGCLMRRKSDEINYKPQVGLLLESGKVIPHFLNISKDKYLSVIDDSIAVKELDIEEFLEELKKLGDTSLEFLESIKQFFREHKTLKAVREIILKAGEE